MKIKSRAFSEIPRFVAEFSLKLNVNQVLRCDLGLVESLVVV